MVKKAGVVEQLVKKYILYFAFLQALVATLGSLFFSEILKFPPCVLCWYQRIAMYPLVIILAIGILKKDKNLPLYVIPLSIIGMAIGVYHNLLYYNILPEAAAPCMMGVSCTTKFIEWGGFITIPSLSLLGFSVITVCMLLYRRYNK